MGSHILIPDKLDPMIEQAWLDQFERSDRHDAESLLRSITYVSADKFQRELRHLLKSRISARAGPVAIYVETERQHRNGVVHRLFREPRRKTRRRAFGGGPRVIQPRTNVNPEVGSEGIVAHIVTEVYRQDKQRVNIHPGPDRIRRHHVRRFLLVTDFIGSGDRVTRYLDAAWRVRSVKSWWSARQSKGMAFEVVAYSVTESGLARVKSHPTQPSVHFVLGCPTIDLFFVDADFRSRIQRLCMQYGSFGELDPLGYGGTGALIAFAHGMPNNAPAILHARSRSKARRWVPLYPQRVTAGRDEHEGDIAARWERLRLELQSNRARTILESPRFWSAPPVLRDSVTVLLSLDRTPRSVTAISARTGLSASRTQTALERALKYDWIDADHRVTETGRREMTYFTPSGRVPLAQRPSDVYIPQSLRAPRAI